MIKKLLLLTALLLFPARICLADGIDAYAELVAHFDNNLTDSSTAAHTITSTGAGSTRSSVQSKFGGYSEKLDGTTAYISIAANTNFSFAADFTVDCWVFTADKSQDTQYRTVFSNGGNSANADFFEVYNDPTVGSLGFVTADLIRIIGTTDVSNSAWHHVELSRSGSTIKLFVDGTQEGLSYTSSQDFTHTGEAFYIGIYPTSLTTGRWNGYIDEFRVSDGIARHTTTFTPPSAAYSAPGVKTYNGLATASVKTVDGLAIASVKSRNGLQ